MEVANNNLDAPGFGLLWIAISRGRAATDDGRERKAKWVDEPPLTESAESKPH
ncbi:MAG: hypothetical protein ACPIOQ_63165 [Promethearchaeia archaeon]